MGAVNTKSVLKNPKHDFFGGIEGLGLSRGKKITYHGGPFFNLRYCHTGAFYRQKNKKHPNMIFLGVLGGIGGFWGKNLSSRPPTPFTSPYCPGRFFRTESSKNTPKKDFGHFNRFLGKKKPATPLPFKPPNFPRGAFFLTGKGFKKPQKMILEY